MMGSSKDVEESTDVVGCRSSTNRGSSGSQKES